MMDQITVSYWMGAVILAGQHLHALCYLVFLYTKNMLAFNITLGLNIIHFPQ